MSYAKGLRAEQLVASFLIRQGVKVLHQNYRCHYGEIDLIAQEGETLCFVEVRYRSSATHGAAVDTIDPKKRRRIERSAMHFLIARLKNCRRLCRFDVVTVEGTVSPSLKWWKGAFEAEAA